MGKLISFHQTMEISKLFKSIKVGGKVINSNFLEEGKLHLFPIHDEIEKLIKPGDKIRVTYFSLDENVVEGDEAGSFKFKEEGVRYEVWNDASEGWDRLYERMRGDP